MKPGALVKARLGGHHRFLFYIDHNCEGLGMYISSRRCIDEDVNSEIIHQILIGDTCYWLYADDFEAAE